MAEITVFTSLHCPRCGAPLTTNHIGLTEIDLKCINCELLTRWKAGNGLDFMTWNAGDVPTCSEEDKAKLSPSKDVPSKHLKNAIELIKSAQNEIIAAQVDREASAGDLDWIEQDLALSKEHARTLVIGKNRKERDG